DTEVCAISLLSISNGTECCEKAIRKKLPPHGPTIVKESNSDEIRFRFKSESHCTDALVWLKSNEDQILVIGTNDIHQIGANETV
ncbi:unnamed protein product, partial [Adineta steineri]